MEITTSNEMGQVPITVFHLSGSLTDEEPLISQVTAQYESGMRYALLDLSEVGYISSSGLRAIHNVFMLLRGNDPEESDESMTKGIARGTYTSPNLKLYKPKKEAMKTLHISGYDMFLEIYKKYKEAIASFG
ncbi:MAG TPA: STAS domain-containing protein [candidate division Zixibacteria bacterium]|nr:STAS domain-containing protein [candidate division Zixibacteria bacterium]